MLQTQRGNSPFFSDGQIGKIVEVITRSTPADQHLCGHRWTTRKVMLYLGLSMARSCGRTAVWMWLRTAQLSWKKPKKILAKAKTAKRIEYLKRFEHLYLEMLRGERTLIYIDEAHIHQDLDSGYGWYFKGRRWLVPSTTPGLHAKINWYGAYNFKDGKAMIWSYPKCNGLSTVAFLEQLAEWTQGLPKPTLIWDGSPVHRARIAQEKAMELGFEVVPLPGYSPDLNPIEGLWKWMREEVTYAYCQPSLDALFAACKTFIANANANPEHMVSRLWPRFNLDPEEEKLRVSA